MDYLGGLMSPLDCNIIGYIQCFWNMKHSACDLLHHCYSPDVCFSYFDGDEPSQDVLKIDLKQEKKKKEDEERPVQNTTLTSQR